MAAGKKIFISSLRRSKKKIMKKSSRFFFRCEWWTLKVALPKRAIDTSKTHCGIRLNAILSYNPKAINADSILVMASATEYRSPDISIVCWTVSGWHLSCMVIFSLIGIIFMVAPDSSLKASILVPLLPIRKVTCVLLNLISLVNMKSRRCSSSPCIVFVHFSNSASLELWGSASWFVIDISSMLKQSMEASFDFDFFK